MHGYLFWAALQGCLRVDWQLLTNSCAASADVGALTSRLGSDCRALSSCVSTHLNIALRYAFQVVGGGVYLAQLSPKLAAVCAGVSVLLLYASSRYGDFQRRAQRMATDILAESNEVAQEVFSLHRYTAAANAGTGKAL